MWITRKSVKIIFGSFWFGTDLNFFLCIKFYIIMDLLISWYIIECILVSANIYEVFQNFCSVVCSIWLSWCIYGNESACQFRRSRFDPLVGKIPWRRKWQPSPVFLLEEFHGQRGWRATVHETAESGMT